MKAAEQIAFKKQSSMRVRVLKTEVLEMAEWVKGKNLTEMEATVVSIWPGEVFVGYGAFFLSFAERMSLVHSDGLHARVGDRVTVRNQKYVGRTS